MFNMKTSNGQTQRVNANHSPEKEQSQEEKINNIIIQAQQFFKNQNHQAAIIKLKLANQKINYFKQNKRQYDKKIELVCLYNLAATYQKQWNLGQCIPLLQKFSNLLKLLLLENLKCSGSMNQSDYQNKYWFKLKSLQIKSQLQYCAVLSQIGQHKKALKIAIELINELRMLFKKSCEQCNKFISKRELQISKLKSNGQMRVSKINARDKIQFSLNVLGNANKTLQELSAIDTYDELCESVQIQMRIKQIKQKLYYWKDNPQNNIKMIKQSLICEQGKTESKSQTNRNILGIKRNHNSWIEQFTISKVMFMNFINYIQLSDADNLVFQFNQRNIMQKIIYLSVSYFSLSIQLRFLEQQKKKKLKVEDNTAKKNKMQVDSKQKEKIRVNSQEQFLKESQIFHLKSIQIFFKYIKQSSPFVNHLIVNYHKHYKNNLNTIKQQNSQAEYSVLYDLNKSSSSSPKKLKRNDSVYYEQEVPQIIANIQEQKSSKPQEAQGNSHLNRNVDETVQDNERQQNIMNNQNQRFRFLFNSTQNLTDLTQKDKTMKKVSTNTKLVTVKLNQVTKLVDKSEKSVSARNQSSIKQRDVSSRSKSKQMLKNSVTLKQNKSDSPTKQRIKRKQSSNLKESKQTSRKQGSLKKSSSYHALDLLKKSGSLNQFKKKQSQKQMSSIGTGMKKK